MRNKNEGYPGRPPNKVAPSLCIHTRFSSNSEVFASELLENLEEMVSKYYIYSYVYNMLRYSTTRYYDSVGKTFFYSNYWKISKKCFLVASSSKRVMKNNILTFS